MVEFSFIELVLLMWAVLATAGYLNAKQDAKVARHILRVFVEDADARKQMVDAFEEFKKKVEAL
jgi:hypothetical protein